MDITVKVDIKTIGFFRKLNSNISGVDIHWIKSPPKQGFFVLEIKSIEFSDFDIFQLLKMFHLMSHIQFNYHQNSLIGQFMNYLNHYIRLYSSFFNR
jgi:hypothetical protein